MAISPTNIQILFTNYDIITYFLNLVSCSEHFISIKHRILATFNINKKNISGRLYAFERIWNPIDFQGQKSRSPGKIFETIQYALCHCKFSYMINQKFMKLCTLQDPNMKMCTLVGYPSPLRFTPVMLF
jgi:hypothetical protein